MTIRITIRKPGPMIVPIRFVRAVSGPAQPDAPDVDDRGFFMGNRPGTWGASDCRGPMVGVTQGDTVRVQVLREDIDDGAPLFIKSTDTSIATVAALGGGAQLGGDGIFVLTGVLDTRNRPVKIQVCLGSVSGPVLGELEPHIFQLHQIPVRAHLVTIRGTRTGRTDQSLVPVFVTVNNIFRTCGIEFQYDPALAKETTVHGLSVPGQMTTRMNTVPPCQDPPDHSFDEFSKIINTDIDFNRVNIYFVKLANEVNGLTFDNSVARPDGYGVVIADAASDGAVAHELCHYLDNPEHVNFSCKVSAKRFRSDVVSLRSVMLASDGFKQQDPAYRNNVGYGSNVLGGFIRIKQLASDPIDGELDRARRRSVHFK